MIQTRCQCPFGTLIFELAGRVRDAEPSSIRLKAQNIGDQICTFITLQDEVWHFAMRGLKHGLQRCPCHSRHCSDYFEGWRVRVSRAFSPSHSMANSASFPRDGEATTSIAVLSLYRRGRDNDRRKEERNSRGTGHDMNSFRREPAMLVASINDCASLCRPR
jgi:hypothetical protein